MSYIYNYDLKVIFDLDLGQLDFSSKLCIVMNI